MRRTSHRTWGWSKDSAPTTWGADWATCGTADHVVITLCPYPCWIQEVSIVTCIKKSTKRYEEISRELEEEW